MPKELKSWGAARDSDWLAAEDIDGLGDVPVRITGMFGPEDMTINGKKKAACCWIEFVHAQTGRPLFDRRRFMTLNAARKKTLRKLFGTDPQSCVDKVVAIYCVDTQFAGETLRGYRIRDVVPTLATKARRSSAAAAEDPAHDVGGEQPLAREPGEE